VSQAIFSPFFGRADTKVGDGADAGRRLVWIIDQLGDAGDAEFFGQPLEFFHL
jgi:hypothetical protein